MVTQKSTGQMGTTLPSLTSPGLGPTPMPTSKVSSYVNTQLAGLSTKTSGQVGLGNSAQQQARMAGGVGLGQQATMQKNSVAESGNRIQDGISSSNQRQLALAQQLGAKRKARAAAAAAQRPAAGAVATSRSGGGNGAPVGQAYQANGSLSASRNRVLQLASGYLGSPYVLGGTTTRGIDCSGLVMMVYNQLGYNVSRHSATWQGNNMPGVRTSMNNLRPGDIVAWKDGSHIAIYAGNGEIIEAANERVGTVRRKLWAPQSAVFGIALRLPGE